MKRAKLLQAAVAAPAVTRRKPARIRPPGERKMQILVDSGAYSAWRLGKPVDLEAYCDFLLENGDWIDRYVGLDVINPGSPEEAAAQGYKNLQYMLKRGLKPIHVYHPGENIDWLHRMLDAGCDYIGLASLSLGSYSKAYNWYAAAWAHLVDGKGRPLVKVHAFGDGRFQSLSAFPWTSADSASWLYAAQRHGQFLVDGGIKLSQRKDQRSQKGAQDVDQLPEEDAAAFEAILARYGVNREGFADRANNAYIMRTYLSMRFYESLRDRVRRMQPIRYQPGPFMSQGGRSGEGFDPPPLDYYLVVGGNYISQAVLAYGGYTTALVSYFQIPTTRFYDSLREFTFDPQGTAATDKTFGPPWRILEQFVTKTEM